MILSSNLPYWSLISAGIARVHSEWSYTDVYSPFTRLYYILEGEGFLHFADRTVRLTPGNMYIVPAYKRHSYSCPDFLHHIYLHVYEPEPEGPASTDNWIFPDELKASEGIVRDFYVLVAQSPGISLTDANPRTYDNSAALRAMIAGDLQRPFYQRVVNSAMIGLIMSEWFRYGRRQLELTDRRVAKSIEFILANYASPVTLEDCARAANLSLHHFVRIFKAATGMTAVNYLRGVRLRRAQHLLVLTDETVSAVARAVGYDDPNYFIRIFRRATGITPARYRRLNH